MGSSRVTTEQNKPPHDLEHYRITVAFSRPLEQLPRPKTTTQTTTAQFQEKPESKAKQQKLKRHENIHQDWRSRHDFTL